MIGMLSNALASGAFCEQDMVQLEGLVIQICDSYHISRHVRLQSPMTFVQTRMYIARRPERVGDVAKHVRNKCN
jgi:hypothetical protein